MLPLPKPSVMGIVDYLSLAVGLAAGFAILQPIAAQLQMKVQRK
tara:strand:+ start:2707 stop:2838 length:132 start_codon:yes stop_codon:yes gene_type:complete